VSDEGNAANDAARDGGDIAEDRESGGGTAVATEPVTRPQRPTGKRSRQRAADAADAESQDEADEVEGAGDAAAGTSGRALTRGQKVQKTKTAKTPGKDRSANPLVFVYNYLKQVVAEMRKVIWPNRKQMLTYTSVVLIFLAIMVTVVGLADLGLAKLILLVFG
jgi:preprotein translocase subunit SecE